jgi:glycosyltransferase involved in cell wall biosynthesis
MGLRVLQIGKYFHPFKGGMEDHMFNLCLTLKDEVAFTILVFNHENRTSTESFYGHRLLRLARRFVLSSTPINLRYIAEIIRYKGEILHLHEPNPLGTLGCLLAGRKKRIVVTYHYDIVKQKLMLFFYRPIQRILLERAERIIVTAKNNVNNSTTLQRYAWKCVVIPLGIDQRRFQFTDQIGQMAGEIKRRYSYGRGIVLFVGRYTYYKGLDYLIEASGGRDYSVLLIGSGEEEESLRRKSEGFRNIHFLTDVEDVVPYYHASDIFVLPSIEKSEAFGIVQLEAMACRTPVICTNLKSGVPEVQINGETGIIVEPKESQALGKAIDDLLDNPSLISKLGEAAYKRLCTLYTNEANGKSHLKIYEG